MDALVEFREELGKETSEKHFMCENKLCNFVITGKFAKLDESALDNDQLDLLAKVRSWNQSFLTAGLTYNERKVKLMQKALRFRTSLLNLPQQIG